jgi:signal transduction histidine kinase/DNA-binding response OmpR family regulator
MEALPAFTARNTPITSLVLAASEKIVRFEFAALHFADPVRNQYAYQLEGFDSDWRYSGDRHEATYTNLDPGRYRLRVKAANKDGVWNETGLSLDLRILPPWWATGWAYLLYILTIGGGATWLYRNQQRRRRTRAEAERIKELDRFKTQFYTNITHEFRTPLTVILGMVKQVREHPTQYLKQGTELIERNGRQLLGLINQLLDLSKLDSQAFQLAMRQGDIVAFLHYLTDAHQGYATTKDIVLRFQTEVDYLLMDFDSEQLRQVISNLLSNALKFTPPGGEVHLGLRVSDGRLEIGVRDTGIGIPADDLPYVFDRFYQVNRRHNPLGGGTGIGLAHARELVRLMDGSIAVASTPGEQTVFTVRLPIWREAAMTQVAPAEDLSAGREAMGESRSEAANQPKKGALPQLLLIEDNPDVVTYLQTCLRGRYLCSVARNGQEGIDRALAQVPDLIISDVMMPQRDGFEVCATLKQHPLTSHIPIVLLTARADAQSRLAGIRRGADVYLAKPFAAEELLAQLERLLARQRSLAEYFSQRIRNAAPAVPPADLPTADIEIEDSFLKKIRTIVSERYSDEDFSLPELCREIGMSRSQLFRKMKALAAISPSEYIRTFRLERARELLANSELNVSEVAWRVGYRDPSYFSKSFQDAFGYLPSSASPSASSN